MIVILVISLVVSNIVKSGSNIVLEGMESKKDDKKEGVYHSKGESKKEGATNKGKKQGFVGKEEETEDKEGVIEPQEDSDESNEGVDESESPCTSDKDCEKGYTCNDKYVCVSAK
jgi:hypothetical protein